MWPTACRALPSCCPAGTATACHGESRWPSPAMLLTAAGMASFGLATQWWHVLLGRVCGWLGRGAGKPVRNVLLTEATRPETYGRAFGFRGRWIAPEPSSVRCWRPRSWPGRACDRFSSGRWFPGILAALLIVFLVREAPHQPRRKPRCGAASSRCPSRFAVISSAWRSPASAIFPTRC